MRGAADRAHRSVRRAHEPMQASHVLVLTVGSVGGAFAEGATGAASAALGVMFFELGVAGATFGCSAPMDAAAPFVVAAMGCEAPFAIDDDELSAPPPRSAALIEALDVARMAIAASTAVENHPRMALSGRELPRTSRGTAAPYQAHSPSASRPRSRSSTRC